MIWRRFPVPETMSLHELHGVLQVAMRWEAIHLIQFSVRGVVHAGPYLCGQKVDLPLSDFRFRRNAKFSYVYDMRCRWEHELRVENRVSVASTKRHPLCIGGSGDCPPEECGVPDGYHTRREEAVNLDARTDLDRVSGFIERIVIQRDLSGLEDEDERWHAEVAADRCSSRLRFLEDRFFRGPLNGQFRAGRQRQLMHQQIMQGCAGPRTEDLLRTHRRHPLALPDGSHRAADGRIRNLIELALQHGDVGLGKKRNTNRPAACPNPAAESTVMEGLSPPGFSAQCIPKNCCGGAG